MNIKWADKKTPSALFLTATVLITGYDDWQGMRENFIISTKQAA